MPPGPVSVSKPAARRQGQQLRHLLVAAHERCQACGQVAHGRALRPDGAGNPPAGRRWTPATVAPASRCPAADARPGRATSAPSGSEVPTSARVAAETTIWPPWASPAMRDARLMSRPTRLPPADSVSPEWRPIRTRTSLPSGHGSSNRPRCAADRRGQRRPCAVEDDEERVALRALLPTLVVARRPPAGSRDGAP